MKPLPLSTGPAYEQVQRINYLSSLFHGLPSTLSENPSAYPISINEEKLEEGGSFAALGHALELTFNTWSTPNIVLSERSDAALDQVIKTIKAHFKTMASSEREAFLATWVERLVTAAKAAGAKPPAKRKANEAPAGTDNGGPLGHAHAKKPRYIDISDSECDTGQSLVPSPSLALVHAPSGNNPASPISLDNDSDIDVSTASPVAEPAPPVPGPHPKLKSSAPLPKLGIKSAKQVTLAAWRKPETAAEKSQRLQVEFDKIAERRDEETTAKAEQDAARKERDRAQAAERQRRKRMRQRAEKEKEVDVVHPRDVNEVLTEGARTQAATERIVAASPVDVPGASRPHTGDWRDQRNGTKGGVVQPAPKRTNYYYPLLWMWIEAAVVQANWSAAGAEKILKQNPVTLKLFPKLDKGGIQRWIVPKEKRWTENTLANIKRGKALGGTGRAGVLEAYPDVKNEILETLKSYRKSKIPVLPPLARATMLAIIEQRAPQILTERFQCSERFVRLFLQANLNWSIRKGTRAAAHIPADWEDQCEATLFRVAYVMKWENTCKKVSRSLSIVNPMLTFS